MWTRYIAGLVEKIIWRQVQVNADSIYNVSLKMFHGYGRNGDKIMP